jgi:hypothetical protein
MDYVSARLTLGINTSYCRETFASLQRRHSQYPCHHGQRHGISNRSWIWCFIPQRPWRRSPPQRSHINGTSTTGNPNSNRQLLRRRHLQWNWQAAKIQSNRHEILLDPWHNRIKQGQFLVYWALGTDNLADYFTKHHSPAHHKLFRSRYLLELHKSVPA